MVCRKVYCKYLIIKQIFATFLFSFLSCIGLETHDRVWSLEVKKILAIYQYLFIRKTIEGPVEVRVINNNVEKALKVAKKKLAADGLFRELKRRRFYEKPSVKKKAKEREAARRRQKWLSKHRTF